MALFTTPSRLGRIRLGASRLGGTGSPLPPPGGGPPVSLPIFEDFERGAAQSELAMQSVNTAFASPNSTLTPSLDNTSFSNIVSAGATATFDPTHTASGALGLKVRLSAGGRWMGGWRVSGPRFFGRRYWYEPAPGLGAEVSLATVTGPLALMSLAEIGLTADRYVYLRDRNGTTVATSERQIPLDLLVRFEWGFVHSGDTGTGEVRVWLSPQSPGAPSFAITATADFGASSDVGEYWIGVSA